MDNTDYKALYEELSERFEKMNKLSNYLTDNKELIKFITKDNLDWLYKFIDSTKRQILDSTMESYVINRDPEILMYLNWWIDALTQFHTLLHKVYYNSKANEE